MFNFLNKRALFNASPEEISAAQTIIDAGKKVKQTFGIEVDTTSLEQALVSTEATPKLIAALSERELPILDTEAVRTYKQERVRYNTQERFRSGFNNLLEKLVDIVNFSGGLTFLFMACVIAIGIPFWIDTLWYDVEYGSSVILTVGAQFAFFAALVPLFNSDEDAAGYLMGLVYTCVFLLITSPLALLSGLTLPWFMTDASKRSWKALPAKDFLGTKVIDAFSKPIALMAIASEVVPAEMIQFDAFCDEEGKPTGEAFLVVDIPGLEQEKLYLWHGR